MIKEKSFDLAKYHGDKLEPLVATAPYVLRITEWKKYPVPVVVLKERREFVDKKHSQKQAQLVEVPVRRVLVELGSLYGEGLRRVLPVMRKIVAAVRDEADIPLELHRYMSKEGLRLRINLPLDEEAGAKLGLFFRLQVRVKELERVELMARRIERFSREEAAYWLSRTTSYGSAANRWAVAGMRIMLGGQPGDPEVTTMLEAMSG